MALRPWERWLFTADITHTAWSEARYMTTWANLNDLSFFDLDRGTRTPNATDLHLGVEHLLSPIAGA